MCNSRMVAAGGACTNCWRACCFPTSAMRCYWSAMTAQHSVSRARSWRSPQTLTWCSRLFFPGGDIGTLAVNGTVNDLAMCGARPLYLSSAFILEEGLPMETLRRVVESMRLSAAAANVQLVTGDTKVVDKGKGDGIFVNTAGIGVVEHGLTIAPKSVRPGDAIILSGDIGRHGIAIMAMREGLSFESTIESDCAPLWQRSSRADRGRHRDSLPARPHARRLEQRTDRDC